MQIGGRPRLPDPSDLAAAVATAAARLGHRPALTHLRHQRREEQGFASLAQWAAKGAHLMELDLGLGPGDRIRVAGPPGWMPVAVCLAAWWMGVTVTTDDAEVAVLHEDVDAGTAHEVLWFGDAVDGSPHDPSTAPAYAVEVQTFPDQPPTSRAAADLIALEVGDASWTHARLIETARTSWERAGVLGVAGPRRLDAVTWITGAAVRPFVTGHATVLLDDELDRDAAQGERVARWIG